MANWRYDHFLFLIHCYLTLIKLNRNPFFWLPDFVNRQEAVGNSLQTRFSVSILDNKNQVCETVWRIKLYPKGCDQDHANYVSIFINQVSGPSVWVKYAISLLGCQGFDRQQTYGKFLHLWFCKHGNKYYFSYWFIFVIL